MVARRQLDGLPSARTGAPELPVTASPILLFDAMDTLVHDPFFVDVPAFFGMSLDELLAAKHPTAWFEFEKGHIDEATYLRHFFADGRPVDGEALLAHMTRCYRWLDGTEELLADLAAAGHAVHALSNYPEWYRLIDEKLGLSRFLEWTFVSCRTGVRKPDPEAYLGAARTLGVEPSACLFVDDREENVAAARDVGMPAIRFQDADALRTKLSERGVLYG